MFNIDGILKALQTDPNMRRQATTGAMAGTAVRIGGHLEGIADGQTYSQIDDRGAAQAVTDARDAGWFAVREVPTLAFDHEQILAAALERLAQTPTPSVSFRNARACVRARCGSESFGPRTRTRRRVRGRWGTG